MASGEENSERYVQLIQLLINLQTGIMNYESEETTHPFGPSKKN